MYKTVDIKINGEVKTYAVNSSRQGLFVYDSYNGIYKQLIGTCDFSVNSPADFMRQFKKEFSGDIRKVRKSEKNW